MSIVIKIEGLWKEYRLGVISHGTLAQDLQSWWARLRGKEDPNKEIYANYDDHSKQVQNGRFWALQDINLEVPKGEILGIIGKNGAGKSTLLKILSRVTAPTNGSIKIKGRIASLLEVGTGFHPELTGAENIFMNGAILGMSKSEIRAKKQDIIDFSGVDQYIDTPVKRYSSGMRVRLAFAVAAHLDPEILIIDEVLAVGDAGFQKKCLGKMSEVASSGRTVLFVSHNMASIQNLCTRATLLKNGKISKIGDVQGIVSEYLQEVENAVEGVPLIERKDRKGVGWLRFESVEFFRNDSPDPSGFLLSGDRLKINLNYQSEIIGKTITVAIAFYTQNDIFLFSCASDAINHEFKVDEKKGRATCHIPRLQLTPGNYYYNIIAMSDNQIIDVVRRAGFINIESGDYYQTGKNPAGKRQGFLVDYYYK